MLRKRLDPAFCFFPLFFLFLLPRQRLSKLAEKLQPRREPRPGTPLLIPGLCWETVMSAFRWRKRQGSKVELGRMGQQALRDWSP